MIKIKEDLVLEHLHPLADLWEGLVLWPLIPRVQTTIIGPEEHLLEAAQTFGFQMQEMFKIWQMNDDELGGKIRYLADFELYDERASDPDHQNIVLDILNFWVL